MREVVVAALWLCPLTLLLYRSGMDVQHILTEIPDYLRNLIYLFFN
ncbi:hypothetical protein LIG30_4526 [Burkholderia sp. lig30]|nr:hypothetical protein LIG30_4526 [Burkholderia sp. lig30]